MPVHPSLFQPKLWAKELNGLTRILRKAVMANYIDLGLCVKKT